MKKLILTTCCLLFVACLFAQRNQETQTKISASKNAPQVTVLSTLQTPSPTPKHTISSTKQVTPVQKDNDSLVVPSGMIVPGNKK
jgi:hypothetical protein